MTRRNQPIIWEVLGVLLLSLVFGIAATPADSQDKIRISYSALSPNVGVLWVARTEGFYKKHGLDAEMLFIESGSLTSQALAAGEIGVAHNAGAPAIISNASGSGEMIIMGLVNSLEYSLVATPKLKRAEDLKGKKIGVSRIGSSSHAAVAIALDHFKLEPKRDGITIIQGGTTTSRVSALKAGSVDATVVDPSFVPFLKAEGYKELSYLGDLGIAYQHAALVANRGYMKKNREKVLRVVKACIEATAFIIQDRNTVEIKRVLNRYFKFDDPGKTDDAYKAVKNYALAARKPYPTVEGVSALIRFFGRFNPAVAKIAPMDVIDTSLVEELDKSGFIEAAYRQAALVK
ncbi:MAG: ABC transporter substrate-binding protein [Deltaproteobacteria bacterium]|nr:ABC transporter substrate-binding protein [Deltaproteobacteria bacterium]